VRRQGHHLDRRQGRRGWAAEGSGQTGGGVRIEDGGEGCVAPEGEVACSAIV
jgi:hypothetical protein